MKAVSDGQIEWVIGLFGIILMMLLMLTEFQLLAYRASSDYMEDALAAGGLACAKIDTDIYGSSHGLIISDPLESYEEYKRALRVNMGVDENFRSGNSTLITGGVSIDDFRIYNVSGDSVTEICVSDEGVSSHEGRLGEKTTPSGQIVGSTGVYGEISYEVQGLFGIRTGAHKSKLVEVRTTAAGKEGE